MPLPSADRHLTPPPPGVPSLLELIPRPAHALGPGGVIFTPQPSGDAQAAAGEEGEAGRPGLRTSVARAFTWHVEAEAMRREERRVALGSHEGQAVGAADGSGEAEAGGRGLPGAPLQSAPEPGGGESGNVAALAAETTPRARILEV